jgi:hypothetical protein
MAGFCMHNAASNMPIIIHDKFVLVGCYFGVTAKVDSE